MDQSGRRLAFDQQALSAVDRENHSRVMPSCFTTWAKRSRSFTR